MTPHITPQGGVSPHCHTSTSLMPGVMDCLAWSGDQSMERREARMLYGMTCVYRFVRASASSICSLWRHFQPVPISSHSAFEWTEQPGSLLFCFLFCTKDEFSCLLRFAIKATWRLAVHDLLQGKWLGFNSYLGGGESRIRVSLDEPWVLRCCLKHDHFLSLRFGLKCSW